MALVTFTDKVDSRIINVPAINKIVSSDIKQLKDGVNTNETDISTNVTAIALNTTKVSFDSTSSNRLAGTSGTNTGDQDLSGFRLITDSYTKTEVNTLDSQNVKLTGAQNISGIKDFVSNNDTDVVLNTKKSDGTITLSIDGNGNLFKDSSSFIHDFKSVNSQGENIFAGRASGNFTMSTGGGIDSQSCFNAGYGVLSLHSLTTGWSNVGMGYQSLYSTTSGKYNTAVGVHALDKTTTSDRNTAVGHYAAYLNTTGEENTVIGASAFRGNETGSFNSFFGVESGYIAGNTSYNSAFGFRALYKTIGGYNTSMGMSSFLNNTTGQEGVAIGFGALGENTTGNRNTALGTGSGGVNTTGFNNVFIGYGAGGRETGSQRLFIDNQSRGVDEATARRNAMIYGEFNSTISSQKLDFNLNRLHINSGVVNENAIIKSDSVSFSRPSDGASITGLFKTLTLGSEGGAKLHGYDGVIITVGGSETTALTVASNQSATFASSVTATNFILSSDKRLKDNIKNVDNKCINANWKTFELKSEKGQKRYGVIAQELEIKNPEFVRTDDRGMKSVAYIDLLIAKIAELESRLEKAGI